VQSGHDTIAPLLTERFLQPYRKKLKDSFSTVIATTTGDLVKKRPGGSLGNLVTQAMWSFTKENTPGTSQAPLSNFVIMNYGGIRLKEIPKGKITIGRIYELLPFENTLVKIKITGTELKQLLRQLNQHKGWPMKFSSKIFSSLGKVGVNQYYELITNNYIAAGGDNCSILKTLPQEDTGILLRDIVIDYLRKQKTIIPDETDYILK
jgi:2',3'-cyclic-nucleotide 2'-phosphodiesterase (5'-nucleotidase family)